MFSEIILIGPVSAGKSTIGSLLAQKLGLLQCSMDDLRLNYYKELNYNEDLAQHIREKAGFWGIYQYWKPFEAYAVERLLAEHNNCVIDFGAGHSVYEDDALFTKIQRILAPYNNVVLILPSPDVEESIQILNERTGGFAANEHFVKHHSNYDLAKFIVYTKGKSPEATCNDIFNLVKVSS